MMIDTPWKLFGQIATQKGKKKLWHGVAAIVDMVTKHGME